MEEKSRSKDSGRVPPQDIVAEKSLLGAVMLSDSVLPDILTVITNSNNCCHSGTLGRCHPAGHTPCTPLGTAEDIAAPFVAASLLYNRPNFVTLLASLLGR